MENKCRPLPLKQLPFISGFFNILFYLLIKMKNICIGFGVLQSVLPSSLYLIRYFSMFRSRSYNQSTLRINLQIFIFDFWCRNRWHFTSQLFAFNNNFHFKFLFWNLFRLSSTTHTRTQPKENHFRS